MTLVQCVQDIVAAGEEVDLIKLREWLEERGIHFPRGGKHPSMMRLAPATLVLPHGATRTR